ncbi:6299_t:CDS:10 [Acaulospora colombiana]|uniref:6299_t:CDS:1 n=1 Tax=Acaulospora colombiana TaxID=27376 RepID=A0ACA9K795_9GLOM|nr:6299_t:CDS:10 [Acaulospora colombiana]
MPAAVNCLAFTPPTTQPLLACGRANGNIEIWNPRDQWNLERTIPGEKGTSIEALIWVHRKTLPESDESKFRTETKKKRFSSEPLRLLSGSSNGMIIEWNTTTLRQKKSFDSHGGAVWSMKNNFSNTLLAVGCEDGGVRIFDITDEGLILKRDLARNKARIMSLAWDYDDNFIVTGSSDSNIVRWNVSAGLFSTKGQLEILKMRDDIRDGTIVSGDSLGHVCFWDGKVGAMLQRFKAHDADVLCLTSNLEGTAVFSSGVDRKCNLFRIVDSGISNNKDISKAHSWVLVGFRRTHLHDVRAIALREDQALVSGGVDTGMVVYSFANFLKGNIRRLPFVPQKPLISISKSKRLLMYRNFNQIKLWKLGGGVLPDSWQLEKIPRLDMIKPQRAVLEMTFKVKNIFKTFEGQKSHHDKFAAYSIKIEGNFHLTASAISENGEWIAVADVETVKVFKIQEDTSNPDKILVRKIKFPLNVTDGRRIGAHQLIFTPDGTKLVIVYIDSSTVVTELGGWQNDEIKILKKFSQHVQPSDGPATTVISITVSDDGKWLATGDLFNRINVYNLEDLEHRATLPKYSSTHTSLTFHPSLPRLIVTLASNQFLIFDIESMKLTDWSQKHFQNLPDEFLKLENRIMGCAFNPDNENSMILWAAGYFCLVDFDKCNGDQEVPLILAHCNGWQKKPQDQRFENEGGINFQLVQRYQPLLFVDFVAPNSMVVVERPFAMILENLPPSFYKAHYGT